MAKQSRQLSHKELQDEYDSLLVRHYAMQRSLSWLITWPLRTLGIDALVTMTVDRLGKLLRRMSAALRRRYVYYSGPAAKASPGFVLYRIIGNDLYPRHAKGQQRKNLEFILDNEPELVGCQKVFIVNRIIDKEEEAAIIRLLEEKGCEYLRIPFVEEDYRKIGFDTSWLPDGLLSSRQFIDRPEQQQSDLFTGIYRQKNKYIMNNNGARNAALRDGKQRNVRWILPWDGNCYLSAAAWEQIRHEVSRGKYLKFFVVPMAREHDNQKLLDDSYRPRPDSEPQIIFRNDTVTEFNENYTYGRRPKVELFWALGVKNPAWDEVITDSIWDYPRRGLSVEAGEFGYAGWTSRLANGPTQLCQETEDKPAILRRSLARNEAITSTINYIDRQLRQLSWHDLVFYDPEVLSSELEGSKQSRPLSKLVDKLRDDAEAALQNGPYSVTDKTSLPPSGSPHDYWHLAPYAWPNPDTLDGLPYIIKDGQRAPGTELGEDGSEQYDRTRLQSLFDDTIKLALGWKATGDKKYVAHAASLIDNFFIKAETRMSPHMTYAQVRPGVNYNRGSGSGIIEIKDIYFFLDAVRIVIEAKAIDRAGVDAFKTWLREFLAWLQQDEQALAQLVRDNNLGTFYDLTVASIAEFIEDDTALKQALFRAQNRIGVQFSADGEQKLEMKRTRSQHYCYFNMQGWLLLSTIGRRHDVEIWGNVAENKATLQKAVDWLLKNSQDWPGEQIAPFDQDRVKQLHFAAAALGYRPTPAGSKYNVQPVFFPHDSIRPYWNLGL